jgi:beta-aspartyl-peptidase (threonine type)
MAALLAAGVPLGLLGSSDAPEDPTPHEKAVRDVVVAQEEAWNKGDLEGYMKGYWRSDKLVVFSNKNRRNGWQETFDAYKRRYQSPGAEMGKLTTSQIEVFSLGPESAMVRATWKLETKAMNYEGWFTLVFRKIDDGWRIVHEHTSG